MIKCDVFELSAEVVEKTGKLVLTYLFYTDLPPHTRAIVTLRRTFLNSRDEECVWGGFNSAEMLNPGVHGDYAGLAGEIDIAMSDQIGADRFREINQSFSAGISAPASDRLSLIVTVGARQRLRAFGKNNANLSGVMVVNSGGINVGESVVTVEVPMADELQPLREKC